MALATLYNTGTISVGAGSTTVTGSGTAWNTSGTQAGDDFRAAGLIVPIASVNSATSITLARPWPGAALSAANYDIRQIDDGLRDLAASNQMRQALGSGTLTSLAALASGANQAPYWTGAGVMATTPITAAARALMDDADAAAMRATLGLVLATSATDTTAGRVARVGDFGLGTTLTLGVSDDLNALAASGFYYNSTAGNTPGNNYPLASAGALIHLQRSPTNKVQIFVSYAGDSSAAQVRKFTRSYGGSGWSPWVEEFHQGRILGTVSQSGGVPTGAVIERGSNANGEYVRFADGTQICYLRTSLSFGINVAFLGGYRSAEQNWTFPAAFIGSPLPCVSVIPESQSAFGGMLTAAPGATVGKWGLTSVSTQSSATRVVALTAIGRWY